MPWDSLETAAKVRDLIKKGAARQIGIGVPSPLVGRVISVDLTNLKAMVWFAGDPEPIEVNLFANTIPGDWARRSYPTNAPSTDTTGYGSLAICQRYNGFPYVTDVLTGGQFSYNLSSVNLTADELLPVDIFNEVAGFPKSSWMSVRVTSNSTNMADGDAVMFGPFLMNGNDSAVQGYVTVSVTDNSGSTKSYRFLWVDWVVWSSNNTADGEDSWWRILPEGEALIDFGGSDWDLDIAYRETVHGFDREKFQSAEVWFRIVQRGATNWINHTVTFHTDLFVRGEGFDGKYANDIARDASDPNGYLGFNQPNMPAPPVHDWFEYDNFGRVLASGWGYTDGDQQWWDDLGPNLGSVDGSAGILPLTAANQIEQKLVYPGTWPDLNPQDVDVLTVLSFPTLPTGASIMGGIVLRAPSTPGSNTFYRVSLVYLTTGSIDYQVIKRITGTDTTVATGTTGISYTAGQRLALRVTLVGSLFTIKFWKYDFVDEKSAVPVTASDSAITALGYVGLRASSTTGNTNTYPYNVKFHKFVGGNALTQQTKFTNDHEWWSGPYRNPRLRQASILQHSLYCTVPLAWTGSNVSWPVGIIRLGNVGRHRDGLSEGSAFLSMPASGVTIPILPNSTFATVGATGIPLTAGQSLWLAVPPGTRDQDLRNYLFIIDDGGGSSRLQMGPPEHSVFICGVPPSDSSVLISGIPGEGKIRSSGVRAGQPLYITATNASWPVPPGFSGAKIQLQGAGGAGGGAPTTAAGQTASGIGGDSGAYLEKYYTAAQLGGTLNIQIGAGGTGVTGAAGNNGGNSTVTPSGTGGVLTCTGGTGNGIIAAAATPSITGSGSGAINATGGDINVGGMGGFPAIRIDGTSAMGGIGANSPLGIGGRGGNSSADGIAGTGYGSGGGGARQGASQGTTRAGGAGAPGVCIITMVD